MDGKNRENHKGSGNINLGMSNIKNGEKYGDIVKRRAEFKEYYKIQNIVSESELELFLPRVRVSLPFTWRLSGHTQALLKIINEEYTKVLTEEQAKPECLVWYPENRAWKINLTRKIVRKSQEYVKLNQLLLVETEVGNLCCQEAASMIPSLVLDVQSHHKVLDMCAAPGGKTTQLIEMLRLEERKIPDGILCINENMKKSLFSVIERLKQFQNHPNVIVTNHPAAEMPYIISSKPDEDAEFFKFDRILCDVSCSGDGTVREEPSIVNNWNPAKANSMHSIQFRIARRGVEMLAVGGKMVYSTCSLNPIEDEAIVHRLLVAAQGTLELVDVSGMLPGLKYSRGLSHWVVTDKELTPFSEPEDVPEQLKNDLPAAIFPPRPEVAEKLHLDKCIRVLPHQQNTSGVFVAVLQKIGPLPWEAAVEEIARSEETTDDKAPNSESAAPDAKSGRRSPARKKRKFQGLKEEPCFHFTPTEEIWPSIKSFYGISDEFDSTLLFSRINDRKRRNLYFTIPAVRDIIKLNFGRMNIFSSGVEMFTQIGDEGGFDWDFRISHKGVIIAAAFISKRRLSMTLDDFIILLSNDDQILLHKIHTFSSELASSLNAIGTGCLLLECKTDNLDIVLVAWKDETSLKAVVSKIDRMHYSGLCGVDVSKFDASKCVKALTEEKMKHERGKRYGIVPFQEYYKIQKIVPEGEWESFFSHMIDHSLPCWRILGHRSHAKAILKIIEGEYFEALTEEQAKPECLPWYPEKLAWQISTSKNIREYEANNKVNQFFESEIKAGNISLQEAVSMISPLVLDLQSHHKVLDMCATHAGSKTIQLIEMLHSEDEGKIPVGFVIVNHEESKSFYKSTEHERKPFLSPSVIITNHDAAEMPNILTPKADGEELLKFDRILCDVPCSNDGALRGKFDLMSKWNPDKGNIMHDQQYRIARRGVEMLAVGGTMVYSTCSLNPIEGEAIVHRLLVAAEGALELIDVSDKLPGLKYSPGLSHWTVTDGHLTPFSTHEDVPEFLKKDLPAAIFPPQPEVAEKFHLDRCIRVLPHQQNTGGIFVAVLKKIRPLPWVAAVEEIARTEETTYEKTPNDESVDARSRSPARKKPRLQGRKVQTFQSLKPVEEIWLSIKSFYGISDDFDSTLLFSTNGDKRRNLYFSTPAVRDIIKLNFERMIISKTCFEVFTRRKNKAAYCIDQEGAEIAINFITKRRIKVAPADLIILLSNEEPQIQTFSNETVKSLHAIGTGIILAECKTDDLNVVLVTWSDIKIFKVAQTCVRLHYLRFYGQMCQNLYVSKFVCATCECLKKSTKL